MDWPPGFQKHRGSLAEVERIKADKCQVRVYEGEFEQFSVAYFCTNAHVIVVIIR